MRRLLLLLFVILVAYLGWPYIGSSLDQSDYEATKENVKKKIDSIKEKPEYEEAMETFNDRLNNLVGYVGDKLKELPENDQQSDSGQAEKPELSNPTEHSFSIYNIEIGDTKQAIESEIGQAQRSTLNEYGVKWSTYHKNYKNFIMVAYDAEDKVVGLFSNQDLITSDHSIQLETPKEAVRKELGEPLTKLRKGFVVYQLQEDSGYDVFEVDGSYVTVFYDKHENNTVTAIQIIDKAVEQNKDRYYTDASPELRKGFEFQLFDLTNAARVVHGLPVLSWSGNVQKTARNHSDDMAENDYFAHENQDGQSPFDRMHEDGITFMMAGENLAYGQNSSIFAHEGLMNSLGHRKNILKDGYKYLGVGVAFNDESQPYYTENFFAK
ncbi:CAP domain-containing protein [Pseudalkalibacillus caeni]|uniref:Serine protease n=1 Tax=Exobacillus caeni TaxID=2574798 RepID=A0A5R9FAW2_9BACL|nr:CAP domain-containing protein [Pseudalkalibacillus caeni]TLS36765.1 serine protease [Pseudalkalibacillus caeni]